jgi:hypothetical protein
MSDRQAIRLLRGLLKDRNHWEIICHYPNVDECRIACLKAQGYVYKELGSIPVWILYEMYRYWCNYLTYTSTECEHFDSFLNDIAWSMGKAYLDEPDKTWFEDNCYFTIKFKCDDKERSIKNT